VARHGRIADLERELRFKDERINESKDEIDGGASYSGTGGASTCRRGYAAQGRVKQFSGFGWPTPQGGYARRPTGQKIWKVSFHHKQ
jgi:hypothetical protein